MSATATSARPALTHDELNETLQAIKIPACPAVVAEVMREAQKDDPDMRVLAKIIASDVGMAAMAMKLANSAMFRAPSPVKSVPQAVNRLGINNILSIVIAVALRNSASDLPPELMERFWNRASTLALAAAVIAKRHVGISADAAYTFALFHDAAIPVLMTHFPDYVGVYSRALETRQSLVEVEFEHFKCSHPIVGWLLARNWGLPPKVAAAIRFHHDPELFSLDDESLTPDSVSLIAVTLVAEHVLAEFVGDADAAVTPLLVAALDFLGTSGADLDEYRDLLAAAIK